MSVKDSFMLWLDKFSQINDLKPGETEQFHFLTYNDYNSEKKYSGFIIYEDWWLSNPHIIKSKISSILKKNKRIYARLCSVKKLKKPDADLFLEKNHLFGSTNSKVKYGLFYRGDLYGVATFAGQRQFKKGRSVELLRYCSKSGYTIVGGLDKLMQAYIKEYEPDSIMTYVDLNWGKGDAFLKIGFEIKERKDSMTFYADKLSGLRIPERYFNDFSNINKYVKIKNNGSFKMIKTLND